MSKSFGYDENAQIARDVVEIEREKRKPAPVFQAGEVLTVKGGTFVVQNVRRRRVTMDYVPPDEDGETQLKRDEQLDRAMKKAAQQHTPVTAVTGKPIPPRLQQHVLRQVFSHRLQFHMADMETAAGKTSMVLSVPVAFELDELRNILSTAPDPMRGENATVEERLRAYEYDELAAAGEEDEKTFGDVIAAASPESGKSCTDPKRYERYELALKLIGERHAKYELVNLVNWLLKRADDAEAANAGS